MEIRRARRLMAAHLPSGILLTSPGTSYKAGRIIPSRSLIARCHAFEKVARLKGGVAGSLMCQRPNPQRKSGNGSVECCQLR